eukprot:scaffold62336_cov69-Phaeocystis_antarctica.AAC.4
MPPWPEGIVSRTEAAPRAAASTSTMVIVVAVAPTRRRAKGESATASKGVPLGARPRACSFASCFKSNRTSVRTTDHSPSSEASAMCTQSFAKLTARTPRVCPAMLSASCNSLGAPAS